MLYVNKLSPASKHFIVSLTHKLILLLKILLLCIWMAVLFGMYRRLY